jgi:hypothetical protein
LRSWRLGRTGLRLRLWGRLGRALGRRWRRFEARGDLSAPDISSIDVGVFVLGELNGLVHGLAEIGEGGGGFGLEVPLGDSGENVAQGDVEIAGGEVIAQKERRYSFAVLLSGLGLRFLLGIEVAVMRVAGASRSAALAAIGKGESAQTGTVFLRRARKTGNFRCGRKTANFVCGPDQVGANGVVRRHGVS